MASRDEFIQAWGTDNIVTYPRSEWMADFDAPAESYPDIDFLPADMSVVYTSEIKGQFSRYDRVNLEMGPDGTLQLLIIGAVPADAAATFFGFDAGSGRIYLLGLEGPSLEIVNSSLRTLAEFLYHFAHFIDEDAGLGGRAARAKVLREKLTTIDARAFADSESWWSIAFAQLEGRLRA